jgi:hypothetical protein
MILINRIMGKDGEPMPIKAQIPGCAESGMKALEQLACNQTERALMVEPQIP